MLPTRHTRGRGVRGISAVSARYQRDDTATRGSVKAKGVALRAS